MSSIYRDHLGTPPPGTERSVSREDLRIRMALALEGEPLQKSVNAVSEGLLDIQSDMIKLLQAGITHRLAYWLMDDIEKADDLFWKHAFEIEKALVNPPLTPAIAQERAWEDEKLRLFRSQIDQCQDAIHRLRATTYDGDPALKEARERCSVLAAMARRLRRKGPPTVTAGQ
jgi:hypothetical protein